MDCGYGPVNNDESSESNGRIIMHPLYLPKLSPWFDLRVFYVRTSNFEVDASTPENLTLNHIPLTPDTVLKVNGRRCSIYSDCVSSSLRRDRVDRRSEEATFVSTDNIRMTGSAKFEVYDKDDLLLSGLLELSNGNGFVGGAKNNSRKWSMKCRSVMSAGTGFLKNKQYTSPEMPLPTIEVYVAGCFWGTPIILSKTIQVTSRKKPHMKLVLDSIPEHETSEAKDESSDESLQISKSQGYIQDNDVDVDYNSIYPRADHLEGKDGEQSWFNAGVRVGVGIGLGICVGVGIGVGLLVRAYQATTRNFKKRLI